MPRLLAMSLRLLAICLIATALSSCGDDETKPNDGTNNASTNGNTPGNPNGAACQVGAPGCGCSAQFPCTTPGYFCVDEVCVECPDGGEGCPCDAMGMCDDGLQCVNPDPGCQFSCEPSTCEQPAECGPTQLCDRTTDECASGDTQEACEAFYDGTNCADTDAYTECNCECLSEATCTDYFDCGQACVDMHCP